MARFDGRPSNSHTSLASLLAQLPAPLKAAPSPQKTAPSPQKKAPAPYTAPRIQSARLARARWVQQFRRYVSRRNLALVLAAVLLLGGAMLYFTGKQLSGDSESPMARLLRSADEHALSVGSQPKASVPELARLAIDCDGLIERDLSTRFPATYQHLLDRVKPVREHNPRAFKRERWWIFGENQPGMRASVAGLTRCVMTTETAKHRVFHLMPTTMLAEGTVAVFAFDDAFFFGVLSSRIHVVWSLATGGRLGVGNDPRYNKTRCFETFPFPTATEVQQTDIRDLAERLDTHRKRQQAQHPKLTFTDLYNVLEKLRAGTPLNAKEQLTHEHGLVTVLRQLHDDLDAAVACAYALPPTASDEAILTHLCTLNAQRAAEERTGQIRYLRPAFQNPTSTATQTTLATGEGETVPVVAKSGAKLVWPKTLAEQAQAVRAALTSLAAPADAALVASQFKGARADRIRELLATLASLGQARLVGSNRFIAA